MERCTELQLKAADSQAYRLKGAQLVERFANAAAWTVYRQVAAMEDRLVRSQYKSDRNTFHVGNAPATRNERSK